MTRRHPVGQPFGEFLEHLDAEHGWAADGLYLVEHAEPDQTGWGTYHLRQGETFLGCVVTTPETAELIREALRGHAASDGGPHTAGVGVSPGLPRASIGRGNPW